MEREAAVGMDEDPEAWISGFALERFHLSGCPSKQGQMFIKADLHGSITAFSKPAPS